MAIWSAVWPKETGKTYHSVPLLEGIGKGLFRKAQSMDVLHSNPAVSVLGRVWVATDDFQQRSLEKRVANTESEYKPQDYQKFSTRPGNYPYLALRSQVAMRE